MTGKITLAAVAVKTTIAMLLICSPASAQGNTDKGLADQLRQQYKLSNTVLVVQQEGIVGVPPARVLVAESTFKDGALHSPWPGTSIGSGNGPSQVSSRRQTSRVGNQRQREEGQSGLAP